MREHSKIILKDIPLLDTGEIKTSRSILPHDLRNRPPGRNQITESSHQQIPNVTSTNTELARNSPIKSDPLILTHRQDTIRTLEVLQPQDDITFLHSTFPIMGARESPNRTDPSILGRNHSPEVSQRQEDDTQLIRPISLNHRSVLH